MQRRYVALLRAITNVPMRPFRRALEDLGFTDVRSYGTSGNLLFSARPSDARRLERRIGRRLNKVVLVRTRTELGRVRAADPFRGRGGVVLFLSRAPTAARRRAFRRLEFAEPAPILTGRTVYYIYPARVKGRRTPLDLERVLNVPGTFRTSRVVERLVAMMKSGPR